jgi:hypothetical protein
VAGAIIATGALVGAVSNGFGTYLAGGSGRQIAVSAGAGALAGAAATATSLAVALGAAPTVIGTTAGILVDIAIQTAFAPTGLPNGSDIGDVQRGLKPNPDVPFVPAPNEPRRPQIGPPIHCP